MNAWLWALLATVAIEVVVAVPLLGWLGSPATIVRRIAVVSTASLLTHPLLWVTVGTLGDSTVSWAVVVIASEVVATAAEAVVLIVGLPGDLPDRRQRVLVAIVMNAVSALVGLIAVAFG